jgi:peptidoglycan/LPS O-acetylase OafA/YrhL
MDAALSRKLTILKSFLIILIVFNHGPTTKGLFGYTSEDTLINQINGYLQVFIADGIARIAVPLFFAISGFLFFRNFGNKYEMYINKVKSRTKTLLVPYLLYSFICILYYYIMHSIPLTAQYFQSSKPLPDYSFIEFLQAWLLNPIPGQLWFIRDLFIFVILSPIFYYVIKKLGFVAVVIIGLLWLFTGTKDLAGDTLFAKNIEGVLFFALGGYFTITKSDLKYDVKSPASWLFVWLVVLGIKTWCTVYEHQRFVPLHRVSILLGFCVLWLSYPMLNNLCGNFLYSLSKYAFAIFLFHRPMIQVFRRAAQMLADNNGLVLLVGYFCVVFLSILISVLLAFILNKTVPKFYNVLVGSRSK